MRISCPAFARLRDAAGRYALLVNEGRMRHTGLPALSPVGGGLQVSATGREYLNRLGATDWEGNKNDLRFRVPDGQVEQVVAWFSLRRQREATVLRELTEELVTENRVLAAGHLMEVSEQFGCSVRHFAIASKPDLVERRTTYLIEVFDVHTSSRVMDRLAQAARLPRAGRRLYFVTADEIRRGATACGMPIVKISESILL